MENQGKHSADIEEQWICVWVCGVGSFPTNGCNLKYRLFN